MQGTRYLVRGSKDRVVEFVQIPSKLGWGLQHIAHQCARNLPPVPAGRRPATLLDSMRKRITQSALDSWTTMFQDEKYQGSRFLEMKDTKGNKLAPTYTNGGTWMKLVGGEVLLCTHMCRAILDHAPIGNYYRQFNIPEEHSCTCSAIRQSCEHIFTRCLRQDTGNCMLRLMNELIVYLVRNLSAFGFCPPPSPEGIG